MYISLISPRSIMLACLLTVCLLSPIHAQNEAYHIQITPENPVLNVGETLQLKAIVTDNDGEKVDASTLRYFSRNAKVAEIDMKGKITAHMGGEAGIIIFRPDPQGNWIRRDIKVSVNYPDPDKIIISTLPPAFYTDIVTPFSAKVLDKSGHFRPDLNVSFSTDRSEIASFDSFGNLISHKAGKVSVMATLDNLQETISIEIVENPVHSIELTSTVLEARTGDVVAFTVLTRDKAGKVVEGIPVNFSFQGVASNPSYTASGLIEQDGRFVAYEPGMYSIAASCGPVSTIRHIHIISRDIKRQVELVGRGVVNNVHTSDLWVWEGIDGRDYAVTGTWVADGEAYFWDVTDPANLIPIDTFKVDARTVNDVKISEDGRVCILSREGASNRKNGIVILDVSNPHHVELLSEFDEGLTGGVHNLFIYKNHVYALSNGERYDIINIENPRQPRKVGTFELDEPGHAVHDVWVVDGIAYSSNWDDGVQMVDVGNGIKGGTPEKPVKIASYTYPSGWNHAAFPFKSPSTAKFYIIAGDEAFPYGAPFKDDPTYAAGYLHVIDFTDLENPKEVAHFEIPGAGSHNFWIDGETLYVANYNAGLRIVDISGDLMGDLFRQGREIGWFIPTDKEGFVPNAAMTWGAQPHKGHIFFSDHHSGLWSVKLEEEPKKVE